jgi:hypothetical protein
MFENAKLKCLKFKAPPHPLVRGPICGSIAEKHCQAPSSAQVGLSEAKPDIILDPPWR